mgnify:CR=1 FL=1
MRYTNLLLIVLLSVFFSNNVFSEEKIISELKKGGKFVFIRHALAPGTGDPDNINLQDCNTQRNLDSRGIEQSKKIGEFFIKNKIPIEIVLSSEWCRCKDTAMYAFKNFKIYNALNSFYDEKFFKFKDKQIEDLNKFIKNQKNKKNIIFISHFVVINEILNISSLSGEIIIFDNNKDILGRIKVN